MRFRLGPGERSGKYRPGQFVSKGYAKRYPGKVRADEERRHTPPPGPIGPEDFGDEWEVTVEYGEER